MIRIKIKRWSATDYAYLVNNQLGWVSDDQEWYEFANVDDMKKFEAYLARQC